jgi:hypothetical protein
VLVGLLLLPAGAGWLVAAAPLDAPVAVLFSEGLADTQLLESDSAPAHPPSRAFHCSSDVGQRSAITLAMILSRHDFVFLDLPLCDTRLPCVQRHTGLAFRHADPGVRER